MAVTAVFECAQCGHVSMPEEELYNNVCPICLGCSPSLLRWFLFKLIAESMTFTSELVTRVENPWFKLTLSSKGRVVEHVVHLNDIDPTNLSQNAVLLELMRAMDLLDDHGTLATESHQSPSK